MICGRCHTENPDSTHYCSKCGTPLTRSSAAARRLPPWYVFLAGALGLVAAGFLLSRVLSRSPQVDVTRDARLVEKNTAPVAEAGPKDAGLAAGYVSVESASGRESSRWASAVVDGAWVALPAWVLLGGGNLTLTRRGSDPIPMEWGVWADKEPVVLCRLDTEMEGKTLRLSPWRKDVQIRWRPLEQERPPFFLGRMTPGRNGSFLYFPLPEEIRGEGLLMQDDNVVGWTFGGAVENGYLWGGSREIDLAPRTRLSELSGPVLSGSREAGFARVLALADTAPPIMQLKGFAEAFHSVAAFEDKDVPPALRPEGVIGRMHALASELIQTGSPSDVARALDDAVLVETESLALIKDVVLARAKTRDYENAIPELARLKKKVYEARGGPAGELSQFEVELYKDWLREIIDKHGAGGLDAFEKAKLAAPDDVEIHLMGVEIAIMEKSWTRATDFLQMRQYPDSLAGRVKMLEDLIQEGQKDEGVAILRFDPGTDHIPVQAYVNGKVFQKFIIDTGATTSTIPSSALDALGVKINDSTKVVGVEGIMGRGLTYEITLDSVELAGLRVYNVKAFIADIARYEDTGLLGQNFLNNFQLDIDYKKGILRIKKR